MQTMDNAKKKFICTLISIAVITAIAFMVASLIVDTIQMARVFGGKYNIIEDLPLSMEYYSITAILSLFLIVMALLFITLEILRMVDERLRKTNIGLLIGEVLLSIGILICLAILFSSIPFDADNTIRKDLDYIYYLELQNVVLSLFLFTALGIIAGACKCKFSKAPLTANDGGVELCD